MTKSSHALTIANVFESLTLQDATTFVPCVRRASCHQRARTAPAANLGTLPPVLIVLRVVLRCLGIGSFAPGLSVLPPCTSDEAHAAICGRVFPRALLFWLNSSVSETYRTTADRFDGAMAILKSGYTVVWGSIGRVGSARGRQDQRRLSAPKTVHARLQRTCRSSRLGSLGAASYPGILQPPLGRPQIPVVYRD